MIDTSRLTRIATRTTPIAVATLLLISMLAGGAATADCEQTDTIEDGDDVTVDVEFGADNASAAVELVENGSVVYNQILTEDSGTIATASFTDITGGNYTITVNSSASITVQNVAITGELLNESLTPDDEDQQIQSKSHSPKTRAYRSETSAPQYWHCEVIDNHPGNRRL